MLSILAHGGGVAIIEVREGQLLEIEAGRVSAKSQPALRKRKTRSKPFHFPGTKLSQVAPRRRDHGVALRVLTNVVNVPPLL